MSANTLVGMQIVDIQCRPRIYSTGEIICAYLYTYLHDICLSLTLYLPLCFILTTT